MSMVGIFRLVLFVPALVFLIVKQISKLHPLAGCVPKWAVSQPLVPPYIMKHTILAVFASTPILKQPLNSQKTAPLRAPIQLP